MTEGARRTDSGIEVKAALRPPTISRDSDPDVQLGRPGEAAVHTRRVPVDVPRQVRGRCASTPGFGTAESTNHRFKFLLAAGPDRAVVRVRPAHADGLDSDHPRAEGEVGKVGVAIDSIADMRLLLADLPLDQVTTSMTINSTASILLLLYELVAEEQGVGGDRDQRHDPERSAEGVHRPRHLRVSAAAVMRIITDIFEYCAKNVPKWNTISISGYHIREAGIDRRARDRVHASPTDRLRAGSDRRRAWTSTSSGPGCRSSGTRTTTSSRRSPSSAPPADLVPDDDRALRRQEGSEQACCDSTPRPAGRR